MRKTVREVLVTGGAGYIGSHLVRQLLEAGDRVTIYDNLSTGSRAGTGSDNCELIEGDTTDLVALRQVFLTRRFDAVFHLAARLVVPESVAFPLEYYANNTMGTLTLLECCREFAVPHVVFSSTAAVYGEPATNPVTEKMPTNPVNPYGHSKLMSEQIIRDFAKANPTTGYVILRYFNVAGADPQARFGPHSGGATNLIQIACDAAMGRRDYVTLYGTDYDTPDGTGVRDYIHVSDLATAHLAALTHLQHGGENKILNCGYGSGYSVREVLRTVQEVSGTRFPIVEAARRPGDPACVIADARAMRSCLDWTPRYDDLRTIIETGLNWEKRKEATTGQLLASSEVSV